MTPIPWMIAFGAAALVALGGKKKVAKAEPVTPVPVPPQPITTQPIGRGVDIPTPKPVPRTVLPPIIPPDAVEIDEPEEVEIITSPGQPIQPIKDPKGKLKPILDDLGDLLDNVPVDPGIIEHPISIDEPIQLPDIGNLPEDVLEEIPPPTFTTDPIVIDVPGEVIDIDEVPEALDATALAVEVYNITADGIRNLKGSEVRTIKAYQDEEGLKVDGLYGPVTAESLIKYGFVPATPWIWPKSGSAQAKRDWRELTNDMAERDPQRADEWHESGNV